MNVGIIGLGRMGAGIAGRLLDRGHGVAGYARSEEPLAALEAAGGRPVRSYEALAAALEPPRIVWLMLPAGAIVDQVLAALRPHLQAGDIVVDGGNSFYKDSMRRSADLHEAELVFLDVGTSGGVWGRENGFCLMVGGDREAAERLRPIFQALAPAADRGWAYLGPSGAGHFTKMIHNGIEYGLMQAYAEGFAIMSRKEAFDLDLNLVARTWEHGSVVRSWLLTLIERALDAHGPALSEVAPHVGDSGMGRWTVQEAVDLDVPAPVLTLALIERISSRDDVAFYHRILAALRHQFGGHAMQAARAEDDEAAGT